MTESQFATVMKRLGDEHDVDYDIRTPHAFIGIDGWQISVAYLREDHDISLSPEYKMPLDKFAQFLLELQRILELLLLKDKVNLHIPGSFVPNEEMKFGQILLALPRCSGTTDRLLNRSQPN